jgi:hypothetical protein
MRRMAGLSYDDCSRGLLVVLFEEVDKLIDYGHEVDCVWYDVDEAVTMKVGNRVWYEISKRIG